MSKPDEWTAEQFRAESARMQNDSDTYSEAVMVGAMMLAALRDTPRSCHKLARSIGADVARLQPYYDNLRRNGIFTTRMVRCQWFDENEGGIAFVADVLVAMGTMNRVGVADLSEAS